MNPILSPGIDIVQPSGAYLLRDEFSVDVAAGSVNGTPAVPGSGTRTVTDTENKMSLVSGAVVFASRTVPTNGDPGLWYFAIERVAGRVFVGSFQLSDYGQGYAGWTYSPVSAALAGSFSWTSVLYIRPANQTILVGNVSLATTYYIASVLRANGTHYFVKGGSFANWTFLWTDSASTNTPLFPGVLTYSGQFATGFIRVPRALWLPVPLVSYGFDSTFGISDGRGHAEGVAGGIGSGGAGVTFSNAGGTWSVSGGKAINTPTLGAELITNGNMETGDPPTGWEAAFNAVLDGVADERTGGSGTQSISVARNGNDNCRARRTFALAVEKWMRVSGYLKRIDCTNVRLWVSEAGGGTIETDMIISTVTAWTSVSTTNRASAGASHHINAMAYGTVDGQSGRFDDLSVKEMQFSELLSVSNLACSDVFAGVALTRSSINFQVGLALNWNSPTAPTSGVIVYLTGSTISVDKCVAGTWSNVSTTAYTYSADARLVCSFNAGALRTYYNNALIKADTITDAAILTGTYHGLFSTDPSNTFDDLTIYATGSSGEYNALNAF